MDSRLRILHLASFQGNFGDAVSHKGLYEILKSKYNNNFSINKLEIRRLYQNSTINKLSINHNLLKKINSYDLFLIGGGGYFNIAHRQTSSGTTFDFDEDFINGIKTRTIFTSIGGIDKSNAPLSNKFINFIKLLSQNKNISLCLRNDGSLRSLIKIKSTMKNKILNVCDNAFYNYDVSATNSKKYVVVNIGTDQIKKYVGNKINYFKKLSNFIRDHIVYKNNLKVIFIPHVHDDILSIRKTISYFDDDFIRYFIGIEALAYDNSSINRILKIYQKSRAVLAGRYHANILGLIFNKPTYRLYPSYRVDSMLKSFDLGNRDIFSNINKFLDSDTDAMLKYQNMKLSKLIIQSRKKFLSILP